MMASTPRSETINLPSTYARKRKAVEYQWKPLNTQRNDIRILKLLGFRRRGPERLLDVSLHNYPMKQRPKYHALSYAWGDRQICKDIVIDGWLCGITQNLNEALLVLFDRGIKYLWVDALCIDQDDPSDKSAQVLRMATIFQEAEKVLVWLGPAISETDHLFNLLKMNASPAARRKFWFEDFVTPATYGFPYDEFKPEFSDLITRDYWRRGWIVQEIAMASRIEVLCGAYSLGGTVIESLFSYPLWKSYCDRACISWGRTAAESFENIVNICHIRAQCRDGQPINLLDLLVKLGDFKTTERVDRVYAIANLAFDWRIFMTEPDYTLDSFELQYLMTTRVIQTVKSLDVILLSTFMKQSSEAPWHCPFLRFDHYDLRHMEAYLFTRYLKRSLHKTRCGVLGTLWNTTNSSKASDNSVFFTQKVFRTTGLKLAKLTDQSHQWEQFVSGCSSSHLLETFDSICRLLMIYTPFYRDQSEVRRAAVGLFQKMDRELYADYDLEAYDEKAPPTPLVRLHMTLTSDTKLQQAFTWDVARGLLQVANSVLDPKDKEPASMERIKQANTSAFDITSEFPGFFLVDSRFVGMVPKHTFDFKPGDEIWLLTGCSMPVIIRSVESEATTERPQYQLITPAMLDSVSIDGEQSNVMNGEAWKTAKQEHFQWIDIVFGSHEVPLREE